MESDLIISPEGLGEDKDLRTKGRFEQKNRSQLGPICLFVPIRIPDCKLITVKDIIWFRLARIQRGKIAAQT